MLFRSVVQNGSSWDVYYGGWDGTWDAYDRISRVVLDQNFVEVPHSRSLVVDRGPYVDVNNPSVVRNGSNSWRMAFTTADATTGQNKPGYAESTDGITWVPSSASPSDLFTMTGYSGWASADVNGGNVIYVDSNGLWHLFFVDFEDSGGVGPNNIRHATSSGFVNYTYSGLALANWPLVINDYKSFAYGGSVFYASAFHNNGPAIWMSVNTAIPQILSPYHALDANSAINPYTDFTSVSLVQDGSTVFGMLCGGYTTSFTSESILAAWLQRAVSFRSGSNLWNTATSRGPNKEHIVFSPTTTMVTGQFQITDTDQSSILVLGPLVTVKPGDQWLFSKGY